MEAPDIEIRTPESSAGTEGRETRSVVLEAFNDAKRELENEVSDPSKKTPENEWILKTITDAQNKATSEGKEDAFTNSFKDFENDREISVEEGIPIDDLIKYIRAKELETPRGSFERERLQKIANILSNNSKAFELPHHRTVPEYLGRVRQEAYFISKDYRATGNEVKDWLDAERALNKRMILDLPPEEPTPPVTPEASAVEPAPETPPELTPEEEGMRDIVATHPIEEETPAPEPVPETLTEEERELRDRVPTHEIEEETPATEGTPAETPPPETSPEAPSPTTPIEDVRKEYSATLGNRQMDVRKRAEDMAERAIQLEQSRGRWFNPLSLGRKIKIRVLEEYFRQQYIARAETAMENNNNTFLEWDVVRNVSGNVNANIDAERQAGLAKIQEVGAGGTRQAEVLRGGTEEVRIAEGEFKTALMNEIITPAANGTIDYQELQTRLRNLVNDPRFADEAQVRDLFGADANRYGEAAQYFATDIFDMAQRIRTDQAAHTFALGELDDRVTINLANLDWAAQSNPRFTGADRAIAWAQRNRVRGWIANPAVIGAATSIGLYGGLRAVGMGARGAAATFGIIPGAGILIGGAFAAIRRNHDLKIDRASDQREQAYNNGDAVRRGRREALRRYNYNIATIDELVNGGERNGEPLGGDTRGINELLGTDLTRPENQEALERRMAEIRSRMDTSGDRSVDLITFRSEYGLQNDRLELVRLVAQGRIALRNAGLEDRLVEERLTGLQGEWNNFFEGDQQNQDRRFRNYRLRNAGGAFLFGGIAGYTAGLGLKELSELGVKATGKDISIRGAITEVGKGIKEARKGLGKAVDKIPYVGESLGEVGKGTGWVKEKAAQGADKLPGVGKTPAENEEFKKMYAEGGAADAGRYHLLVDENHNVTLVDKKAGETIANDWRIEANGHITAKGSPPPEVLDQFKKEGFSIDRFETTNTILDGSEGSTVSETLGRPVAIPQGTEWVADPSNPGKFDLIVSGRPNQILVNNALIEPNGKLIFESSSPNIDLSSLETTIPGETQTVFGENGIWEKNATQIAGRQWYGNNTPGFSDLNELRAYNSLFTASDGQKGVVWDMSHMDPGGSFQTGNTPPSVDVQQVIRNNEAVFAFSTHDHQGNPIIIRDISDGVADGKFVLDPTDTIHHINPADPNSMTVAEFSQLVLNQEALQKLPDGSLASELFNHRDVFNLGRDGKNGFMEAGRLSDGSQGKILQVFATGQGNGQAPEQIIGAPKTVFENSVSLKAPIIEKIPAIEFTPPGEGDEIPVIPIPFAPRHPLERTAPAAVPPPPYGYGRGYGRRPVRGGTTVTPTMPEVTGSATDILEGEAGISTTPTTPSTPGGPTPPAPSTPPSTTSTRTTPTFVPIVETSTRPSGNVVENINNKLSSEIGAASSFELTPTELVAYLKTVPLPSGAEMRELDAKIEGGNIVINGAVYIGRGTSKFNANLIVRDGKIVLIDKNIRPALIHRPFIRNVETFLSNINDEIAKQINSNINPSWKVTSYSLSADKIGVNFGRTVSAPSSPPTTAAETLISAPDISSSVEDSDKSRAEQRMNEFINSEEVRNAEEKGGITRVEAGQLYGGILNWLKSTNIPEAERDDPSLNPTAYKALLAEVKNFSGITDVAEAKKQANLIAKFVRDKSVDISKGDISLNSYALALLYDLVKDIRLK